MIQKLFLLAASADIASPAGGLDPPKCQSVRMGGTVIVLETLSPSPHSIKIASLERKIPYDFTPL